MSGSRHRQLLEVFLAGILLLVLSGRAQAAPPWMPFGPGGGSVFSLAVDPGNAAMVYAVAGARDQDATLYRSADGGLTWTALVGPGLARVALDPSHPSTIYAGGFQRLLRSLDGGNTSDVSPPGLGEVTVLTVGPDGTVFAADFRTGAAVLQRSADGGASWREVATETSGQLGAVAVDPADPSRVYYGGLGKVRRSLDGGVSWEDAGSPPGLPFVSSLVTLPAAPPGPTPFLLLGFDEIAIYRSDDGARTWTTASTLPASAGLSPTLVIDTGAPEHWHVTSRGGSLNSTDGGRTWTLGGAGLPRRANFPLEMSALAAAPSRPGLLYAGFYEWGVTDAGESWRLVSGSLLGDDRLAGGLAVDAADPDTIYVGTLQGVRVSHDGGRTLAPAAPPFEVDKKAASQLWTFRDQPGTVYAAGSEGGLFVGRFE